MLLTKAMLFTSYSPEVIPSSSQSMNMTELAKLLILTTGIFLLLVLGNYYSLNAPNSRRLYFELTRATNAGLTTLKYLLF